MTEGPRWAVRAELALALLLVLLLFVQYVSGIWTNVYAPAMFTSSSSSSALDAHYDGGFALGLLAIVAIAVAVVSRRARLIGQSVGLLLWIAIAGIAGHEFVSQSPNPPVDSVAMAVAFLLAFGTAIGLVYSCWRASTETPPPAAPVGAPA